MPVRDRSAMLRILLTCLCGSKLIGHTALNLSEVVALGDVVEIVADMEAGGNNKVKSLVLSTTPFDFVPPAGHCSALVCCFSF